MYGKPKHNETKKQARKRTHTTSATGESEEWLFTALQAMRETDHRVKNNLQSIAALLDMQVMTHGRGFSEVFSVATAGHFGPELVESIGRLDLGGQTT